MIVKRKLYSVMDEEGNQGYYLYDEATGEEKMFAVMNSPFVGKNGKMAPTGFSAVNKNAKRVTEANTPLGGVKHTNVFRYMNSPMTMKNPDWIKETGANKLQTKISIKGGDAYLGRLSGTGNKQAFHKPGSRSGMPDTQVVGGGYWISK